MFRTSRSCRSAIGFAVLVTVVFPIICRAQAGREAPPRDRSTGATGTSDRSAPQQRLLPPPRPRPPRHWYLGVRVRYLNTGAEITDVVQRSPAARVGLEPHDLIVTVAGYQVGDVDGRLYPLDRELDLRVSRDGRVRLLVQNHRNGELTNVDARLRADVPPDFPDRKRYLIGTVTSRSMTQLPRDAHLVIQVVDKTHRLGPLTPVLQKEMSDLGPLPIPFEIEYTPQRFDPQRSYAMRAYVEVHGLTALRTRVDQPILQDGQPARIRLVLERSR